MAHLCLVRSEAAFFCAADHFLWPRRGNESAMGIALRPRLPGVPSIIDIKVVRRATSAFKSESACCSAVDAMTRSVANNK